ncbi:MAG: hemerythrin family protein [Bacteroidota bacterium]|nr:hemerythrin family protein [Bacteroidota bacterium]
MEIRNWEEKYKLNQKKIDEHHKKFLDIINMLIKISNERSCEEEISLVFFRLIYYVDNFLIEEEIYLKENKYPKFKQHKEAHNTFIHEILKLQNEYQNRNKTICKSLLDFLQNWFDKHILETDKEAVGFIINSTAQE